MAEKKQNKNRWELFTLHYGSNEERVPMTRVLFRGNDGWVIKVTDLADKVGKVIAECMIYESNSGRYFTTHYYDFGHLALCRHLREVGVGGYYSKWLKAVEGNNEEVEKEYRMSSKISFGLQKMYEEKEDDWTIHTELKEEETD
jgi:hypothetical protein